MMKRMLEFYYDFLDRFIDTRDYELIQMDTDSLYFALSGNSLDDVGACHKEWLAWDQWSNCIPDLGTKVTAATRIHTILDFY